MVIFCVGDLGVLGDLFKLSWFGVDMELHGKWFGRHSSHEPDLAEGNCLAGGRDTGQLHTERRNQ